MEIRTFIGRKLNYINGILRRQIEIDRNLKNRSDVKLTYEYYDAPKNPIDFFSKRYFFYPIYSYLHSRNSDKKIIYHINFQYLSDLVLFLDKSKTIITCHDIFTFLEKGNIKNPFIVRKYSSLGLKKCKFIISISEFTKNELINKLGIPKEKIIVIKNGINREMFKPIPQNKLSTLKPLYPSYKKILHVGSEVNRKNFLTLLKALYLTKKKAKKLKLIRIGQPRYINLIKLLRLEKDIIYLKNINNKRLREIYNLCDFFVYPSLYEGWGAPGLEAASCGTPVICSDIPIFREIYQDFPLYFPSKNYKILAKIILENLNNEDIKQEMIKKGIKIANSYSWKRSAEKYLKYAKLIIEN
ncbi:MAG: glycosyltransferase family 4 protein [Promethearchaeota archaeon]